MSLIEKIDAEIFESGAEVISIKNKGMFISLDAVRKIIKDTDLSEQKEPCEQHKEYKGAGWSAILDSITTTKPLTIGDKIRESNESILAFIRGQFGDDRVFHGGGQIDLDEFLNQPYTE